MSWVLHHVEPVNDAEAPSRVRFAGRLYCRRAKQRSAVAAFFGTVLVSCSLYEPLQRGVCAMQP